MPATVIQREARHIAVNFLFTLSEDARVGTVTWYSSTQESSMKLLVQRQLPSRRSCPKLALGFRRIHWAHRNTTTRRRRVALRLGGCGFLIWRVPFPALSTKQEMTGLLIDTCNNVVIEGYDEFEVPNPGLDPPAGGDQTANVVITGDSSGITLKDTPLGAGAGTHTLLTLS